MDKIIKRATRKEAAAIIKEAVKTENDGAAK